MKDISELIVEVLIKNELVLLEEKEIYVYGIKEIIKTVMPLFIAIAIGVLFRCPLRTGIIYVSFSFIRKYCGGYHISNNWMCLIISSLILVVFSLITYIPVKDVYIFLLTVVFIVMLLTSDTIDNDNRRLSKNEKKMCKKCTVCITITEFIIAIILYCLKQKACFFSVCLGISLASILHVVAILLRKNGLRS